MKKTTHYYYMNKEHGYLVTQEQLFSDAIENGYDDITDPCCVEYGHYFLHYSLTNYVV